MVNIISYNDITEAQKSKVSPFQPSLEVHLHCFLTPLTCRKSVFQGPVTASPAWGSGRRPSVFFLCSILTSSHITLVQLQSTYLTPFPSSQSHPWDSTSWYRCKVSMIFPNHFFQPFLVGYLHSFLRSHQPAEQFSTTDPRTTTLFQDQNSLLPRISY